MIKDSTSFLTGGSTSSTTSTWAHTCLGYPLFVCVPESRNVTISATYAGAASDASYSVTNGNTRAYIFVWKTPAQGSNNVVVTYSSAITSREGCAISFLGGDRVDPVGANNQGTGTTQNKSLSLTTLYQRSFVIDALADLGNVNTPASPAVRFDNSGGNRVASWKESRVPGSNGTSYTGSVGTADYSYRIVEVRAKPVAFPACGSLRCRGYQYEPGQF